MMKRWGALALMLVMILGLTACGQPDPAKDAATVVAEVGDTKITKGEAQTVYDFVVKQIASMYGMDPTDAQLVSSAKQTTLGLMAEGVALEKQLATLGMPLTDADLTEIQATAKTEYEGMISTFVANYGGTEDEAKAEAVAQGYTEDAILFFARRDFVDSRLREVAIADVTVTDEEIQAKYDELVATQTETYTTTPGQYCTDVLNGNTIYVRPAGYRHVKNLVVGLPEDIQTQISDKRSEEYSVMYQQYTLNAQLSQLAETDTAGKKTLEDQIAAADADYARLEEEVQALVAQGVEQIKPNAEEILAKCKAPGADFDALLKEYSADTVQDEEILAHGYPVSADTTSYVASFTEGAMALQNIGDISGLVQSDYGFHILLYYEDVEPGTVPLDDVRAAISESLLVTKQDEAFTAKETEWIEAAKIKTYPDKL